MNSVPLVARPAFLASAAFLAFSLIHSAPVVTAQNAELQDAIDAVKAIQPGGLNHDEALKAISVLNHASAADVPQMLQGMDGASKISLNWLRGGIQSALDRGSLPRGQIEKYFNNRSGSAMGRLMAFELLSESEDSFASSNIPKMIDDPSLPLRQMAVADLIEKSEEADDADAIGMLGFALAHARDVDQVQSIVGLMGKRGVHIDLQKQLGFVPNWHLAGPFDNSGETGFDAVLGPEKNLSEIDLTESYADSKTGDEITWSQHNSIDPTGSVDLNKLFAAEKGVLAYGFTEFKAEEDQAVEIRIGCINGNKVWVNGEEIINNEIYHVGMMPDQFVGKANLKKGTNTILIKVCQNEQTQPWANLWTFQLRVCEADGKAVLPARPAIPRQ